MMAADMGNLAAPLLEWSPPLGGCEDLAEILLDEVATLETALVAIQTVARVVARGESFAERPVQELISVLGRCTHTTKVGELLGGGAGRREGEGLLSVMADTIGRLDSTACAPRQFFHAARGFVVLRRAALANERRSLTELAEAPRAIHHAELRASWIRRDQAAFGDLTCSEAIRTAVGAVERAFRPSRPPPTPARVLRPLAECAVSDASNFELLTVRAS
jgi:hypothetical protein